MDLSALTSSTTVVNMMMVEIQILPDPAPHCTWGRRPGEVAGQEPLVDALDVIPMAAFQHPEADQG